MVKTKIIATLGPASSRETTIRKMMLAGMDVVRFNFSHANTDELLSRISIINKLNSKYHRHIRFLGDLQGHRIRIGSLHKPILLIKHRIIYLTQKNIIGTDILVPFDYKGPLDSIKTGHHIFIDDGNISLQVTGRSKDKLKTKVIVGGLLKEHKGVNIPDAKLKFDGLNMKDIIDAGFCQANGVDYVAQSFVRTKNDIDRVRALFNEDSGIKIIAKIENRDGINNIDSIIKASDGIMIARGDMGVSIPIYEIPIIQKMIIKKCNKSGKFVITATQMLESMTENLRPTRAEVTDVANAIIDGADFVMLSGESAVGKYPSETITMMNNIIKYTEKFLKQ